MLANQGFDQRRGRYIEGGIVDLNPVRCDLAAEGVGDFQRVALFDRNLIARGKRKVERARRRGHVEWHTVCRRGQGHAVGADLVGGVAVGRYPVGTRNDRLHPTFAHHLGGHRVANQRDVDTALFQLPGGEPCALQERPGFVGVDVQRFPRLGRGEEDRQRGAVVAGGQSAGVAVGEHAVAVGQEFGPVTPYRPTHLSVFFVDRSRLGKQLGGDFGRRSLAFQLPGDSFHPFQGPDQVDRRGPAAGQVVGGLIEPGEEGLLVGVGSGLQPHAQTIGGGNPDGRGPTDAEHLDRLPNRLDVPAFDLLKLHRKQRLVDHLQVAVDIAHPMQRVDVLRSSLAGRLAHFLSSRILDCSAAFLLDTLSTSALLNSTSFPRSPSSPTARI